MVRENEFDDTVVVMVTGRLLTTSERSNEVTGKVAIVRPAKD